MAGLDRLLVSGDGDVVRQRVLALGLGLVEQVEQRVGLGDLEVPFRHLLLVFEKHLAIGHAAVVEGEIVNAVDALDIHGEAFEPVGQFARHRLAVEAAHLLEIGKLGDFHPVAPDFPAQSPRAQRRAFPVVFHEADVVLQRIDADDRQALEIEVLNVRRAWLQDHLILIIVLEAIGVLAITPVGRAAAGLHERRIPRLRAQRAQRGRRVKGARAHTHVVGLQNEAPIRAPEIVEREDHVLKGFLRITVHAAGNGRCIKSRQCRTAHMKRMTGHPNFLSGYVDIVSESRHIVSKT